MADEAKILPQFGDSVDRMPVQTVVPAYPEKARRDRLEGEVQVCFHIDRDGKPYRIAVRKSTHRVFEKPARRAVRESRFKPLQDGEEEAPIKNCRTFQFRLDPVEPQTADGAS